MAKPTSAFFSAGPSLVPSPVTATTWRPSDFRRELMIPVTRVCLSVGEERARTLSLGQISSIFRWEMLSRLSRTRLLKSFPGKEEKKELNLCPKSKSLFWGWE